MKTTPRNAALAKLVALFCAALAASTHPATAGPGDLDLTFAGTGKVTTDIHLYGSGSLDTGFVGGAGTSAWGTVTTFIDADANGTDTAYSVALQSDEKIVVAGISGSFSALARFNANGSLDTSFNGTGKVKFSSGGSQSVAIQSDGKIVVAGVSTLYPDSDFALSRFNANGSMDTTFNGSGFLRTDFNNSYDWARSVVLQSDGKIVVAGYSAGKFALARYNANGSLDTSFNGTGKVTTDFNGGGDYGNSVALQNDGKIVVAGRSHDGNSYDFAMARYNTDGSLDTSFNGTGKVTTDFNGGDDLGNSVALQNDGSIVVAGSSVVSGTDTAFALARYNANGSLDTSFNGSGKLITNFDSGGDTASGVAIQPDGSIVAAGYARGNYFGPNSGEWDFALARYEGFRISEPVSQTVNLGSAVTFSVAATGITPTGYQWKKDGVDIPGATASSYTIPSAHPWDIGGYSVAITHSNGTTTTNAALLEINGVPTGLWRGLLVYYPFDGNAQDREAGGAHAIVSGASLVTDRFRQPSRAFDFDGINDQMTATVPNLPVGSAPRTVSLWAKARPDPSRGVGLVEWGLPQNGRAFGIMNNGDPYTWAGKTYGGGLGVDSGVVVDTKWHHVCLTYDGGTLAIYLDGALKHTESETINTALSPLTMGIGVEGYASNFYPGSLDEVRIYNRALSASDIQQLNALEDPDTDGDGIRDRFETGTGTFVSAEDTGTSPTNPDSDGDGLNDGDELNSYHTNPAVADTDGDGFDDGFEVSTGFSPTSAASTPDALSSIRTAAEYRFNAANGISYRIEASTDLANWQTIEPIVIGTGGVITRFYSIERQAKRFFRSRRN